MPRKYTLKQDDGRGQRLRPNTAPDTQGDTIPLTAKVTPDLKAWVIEQAAAAGISNSQLIREALEFYRRSISS
jgi:hypothetical protein